MKIINMLKKFLNQIVTKILEDDSDEIDFVRNYSKYSKIYRHYNL